MPGEETLRLLRPDIAECIRRTRASGGLRRVARECAQLALDVTGYASDVAARAVHALANLDSEADSSNETAVLRHELEVLVERLDVDAFDLHDKADNGQAAQDEYVRAFRTARAVASILAAMGSPADKAAAETCYEAVAATGDPDRVAGVVVSALRGSKP